MHIDPESVKTVLTAAGVMFVTEAWKKSGQTVGSSADGKGYGCDRKFTNPSPRPSEGDRGGEDNGVRERNPSAD